MGVTVAVTRVAANTSTGTQDITTADLGGLTPKAVLLIATRGITDGSAADGAGWYMGASDGTNEWAQGYEDQHAEASVDQAFEQDTTANRILTIYDGTADDVVEGTANFDSFISDGVRINWTDAPASAFLITAIFFAGTDLSVHVGTQTLGNTADALIDITSVGFEPDNLITVLLEGTHAGNGSVNMGVVHNDRAGAVVQRGVHHHDRQGFASAQLAVQMRDGECLLKLQDASTLDWFGAATAFDSSGFSIQLGNARPPVNHHVGWLALRYGSSPVVLSKVYTYSTPTGTGSHTDSSPGFEPQFVMYLPNRAAAVDTNEVDADGGVIGLLVVDADEVYTNSIASEDGAVDVNSQSLSDDILNLPTHTGASGHQATLTSMGSTGPVWNFSATDATARLWPALAIEKLDSDVVISCGVGALGLNEHAATLVPGAVNIACAVGALSLAEHVVTISNVAIIVCGIGALNLGEQAASVIPGEVSVACAAGALNLNEHAAAILPGAVSIACSVVALALAEHGALVLPGAVNIACAVGALDLVEHAATISNPSSGVSIACAVGALALAEHPASLLPGPVTVACRTGSLSLAGLLGAILVGIRVIAVDSVAVMDVSMDSVAMMDVSVNSRSVTSVSVNSEDVP